jgi:uncharacterized lipoprotein
MLAAMLVAMLGSAGCAAKKDTRYLHSHQPAPLEVPVGLDTPAYTQTMALPAAGAARDARAPEELETPPRRIAP